MRTKCGGAIKNAAQVTLASNLVYCNSVDDALALWGNRPKRRTGIAPFTNQQRARSNIAGSMRLRTYIYCTGKGCTYKNITGQIQRNIRIADRAGTGILSCPGNVAAAVTFNYENSTLLL